MHDFRLRFATESATIAFALVASVLPLAAAPQHNGVARVAGSYVATHLNGSSVVRLELSLLANGTARLRTGASRYSQRPEGVAGREVIETGTWHIEGKRVVLHIEKSSADANDPSSASKPSYADRSFVLMGCELHLVGSALEFDKKNCS